MYFKKSAHRIARATSDGSKSVYQAFDRDERASGASALPPPTVLVDAAIARIQEVPSQADHAEARDDIPACC